MKCLLWWTRDGKLDEQEYSQLKTLLRKFTDLLSDKSVSVVMAEVHK